jgi:hypothetical protein
MPGPDTQGLESARAANFGNPLKQRLHAGDVVTSLILPGGTIVYDRFPRC